MIVKDRRPEDHHDHDRRAAAGAKTEEQMAFYLKRAFGDSPDVLVLHDLRLENQDGTDAAQIDHLVIHTGGMVIVESKSVTTRIRINDKRDFARFWNGEWRGMDSPIQQSKMQAQYLQKVLIANAAKLRDKALFGLVQKQFNSVPFDILVAISNSGIVERGDNAPEVLKADHVCDRIRDIMAKRCINFAAFALKHNPETEPWASISQSEMQRIADFLVTSHRPLARKAATPAAAEVPATRPDPLPPARPAPAMAAAATTALASTLPAPQVQIATKAQPACRHCASTKVAVTYGKFGYYLKCAACAQNTKIDFACSKCGKEARIRKDKLVFYRECACGHGEVYHVNEA